MNFWLDVVTVVQMSSGAWCSVTKFINTGFVQTLESPGIKMLRFPGLESLGNRHRSWKTLEKSWNSKVVVLEILISGTGIANLRRNSL